MLPNDVSRCLGESQRGICPARRDCERYRQWQSGGAGWVSYAQMLCQTEKREGWIPRPCAGRTTRVSNRPHPLCRNCSRWQYGITGGIKPDWRDEDGTASCGDRVGHGPSKVVGAEQSCAPTA